MLVAMEPTGPAETSTLLRAARQGDGGARERLFTTLYDELRQTAGRLLAGQAAATLQPTALVSEAWLRLAGHAGLDDLDRTHFVGIAARAMRFVLLDHWRARRAQRRGGGALRQAMTGVEPVVSSDPALWLAVHEALERLAAVDPELERIAELRLFGGLGNDDIASSLGISLRSVERGWRSARAFLVRAVDGDDPVEGPHAR